MFDTKVPFQVANNRILAALPKINHSDFFSKLDLVELVYGEDIYQRGEIIENAYFPKSGLISILGGVEKDSTLEVGLVGNEGMVGISLFLGVNQASNRVLVQGSGEALRIKAADFLKETALGGIFAQLLLRFTYSLLMQVSQSAACYRFHPIEARLSRWLLMTADRMDTSEFSITQEFLANMLGVRREAVNKAAGILQNKEIIRYSRGHISIISRPLLERETCQCYFIIRDEEASFPIKAT